MIGQVEMRRVGDVVRAQDQLDAAATLYREGLEVARTYQQQQPCPDADIVVAYFEDKLRSMSEQGLNHARAAAKSSV